MKTTEKQIKKMIESSGMKQISIVAKMQEAGIKINDVTFSIKKKGRLQWTENEKKVLNQILNNKN